MSQEQELLRQTISEMAQSEIVPLASKIDWEGNVPEDLRRKLPGFGLLGITIPQEFGGAGADFSSLVLAVEELSKASGSLGAQVSFHNGIVAEALIASTNNGLRNRLLPKLASGVFGACCLEPNTGISCRVGGGKVLLSGRSEYVMSAASAGVFLVLAKKNDGGRVLVCFSIDDAKGNVEVGPTKKLLGMRAADTASVTLHNLELSLDAMVFEPERIDGSLAQLFARSRLAVAAQALGIGQASLDAEIKYSNERSQFKTKIGSFYAVRDFIAQDEVSIQNARCVTYSVASQVSTLATVSRDSAIAKVSSSNSAVQAARHSIRVHGGYGFVRDYPVERYLRDARATQIYIESNESLKSQIAGSLLGTQS
jgi:alkylation response protein AidB-like acyl-CoA dehydrogenase